METFPSNLLILAATPVHNINGPAFFVMMRDSVQIIVHVS